MELSEYLFSIKLRNGSFFNFDFLTGKALICSAIELSSIKKSQNYRNMADYVENMNRNRLSININVTNECNLNCPYCYFKASNKVELKMSINPSEVLSWLNQVLIDKPEINEIYLGFLGGEPLIKTKEIFDIVDNIRVKYPHIVVRFSITSNGVFLTEQIAKQLELRKCESIQLTLDGNERLHNISRCDINNNGTYRIILNNAKVASKYLNVVFRINFTETTEIILVQEMLNDIRNSGIKNLYFAPIEKNYDANRKSGCESIFNTRLIRKYVDLWNIQKKMSIHIGESLPMIYGMCIAKNSNGVTINYDGNCYSCPSMCGIDEFRLSSIKKKDWPKKKYTEIGKECEHCVLCPICFGGCSYQEKTLGVRNCRKNEKLFLLKKFFSIKYDLEVF